MDFSLESEFLASTSTDGSARIWKTEDGVPLMTLTRNSDEAIELCRLSKDATKPFLFCTVQKGNKAVTAVYDISTWNKIGIIRVQSLNSQTLRLTSYKVDMPSWELVPTVRDKETLLQKSEVRFLNQVQGPESIAFDPLGRGPYTGVADGRVTLSFRMVITHKWNDFAYTSS